MCIDFVFRVIPILYTLNKPFSTNRGVQVNFALVLFYCLKINWLTYLMTVKILKRHMLSCTGNLHFMKIIDDV